MPSLTIQETELQYDEKDIVNFNEGLIGLPNLRRMVLVRQPDIEPLLWLASLDEAGVALVVAETASIFPGYAPPVPGDSAFASLLKKDEQPLTLAIVQIAPEGEDTTANLRAPIFVSASTMRGAQVILPDDKYDVSARLPVAMAAS